MMQFIQDEDASAAASTAFDNVGFESAGTAIRAVAEDIEIRTEEDGSYTIVTGPSSSSSKPASGSGKKSRPDIKYEKPGDDARQAMVERTEARLEKTLSANKSRTHCKLHNFR